MKRFVSAVFFALACLISLPAWAEVQSGELHIETLVPTIPVSMYDTSYNESSVGQTTHHVQVGDTTRSYQFYAPRQGNDRARPAIMLLHGANRSGVSMIEKWKSTAKLHNIILIAPNGTNNRWVPEADGTPFLNAVVADAGNRVKIDPKRLYLFGHSAGGNFALYISIAHSQAFAATAVHAGSFYKADDYANVAMAQRKIPVAIFVGTRDDLYPLETVKASARAFAAHGHDARLYILDGHNHWYYDLAPFINGQAWDFLSRHHL